MSVIHFVDDFLVLFLGNIKSVYLIILISLTFKDNVIITAFETVEYSDLIHRVLQDISAVKKLENFESTYIFALIIYRRNYNH